MTTLIRKVKDLDTKETRLLEGDIIDMVDTLRPPRIPIADALRVIDRRNRWVTNSAIISVVTIVGVVGFGLIFYLIEKLFL
jgi:hypothetical protein